MTQPTDNGVDRYTGNGATSTYSYTFKILDDDDIQVIVINTTTRTRTVLTKNTHYTVSGAGDSAGGSVTLISPWADLSSSYSITLRLNVDANNQSAFRNGNVNGVALEDALDRMSQRIIKLEDDVERAVKLPNDEAGTVTKTNLGAATDRASKYLTFDSSGNVSASTTVDEGSLAVTAIGETIVEAANAGAVLDALGFTTFTKTIVDDTTAAAVQTTLGISAAAQTVLDDASVAAMRTTLGLDGASGAIASLDIADAATAQIFQARLTLTSATPVTTADVTAAGTIYLTPYKGNKIAVYNGTRWKLMPLTEISLALTATSGKPYDVWVYDNSGTLTLETTVWTNSTTRATALATQDGVYCKTGALTRRYVGTFYASGTDTTEDSAAKRFVWNYNNRVRRHMFVKESEIGWNYTTATMRQARGSTANQLDLVIGVAEDMVDAELYAMSSNTSANIQRYVGIGEDSTTAEAITKSTATQPSMGSVMTASMIFSHHVKYSSYLLGRHYLTWLEYSDATGTTTFYGTLSAAGLHAGISGTVFA